MVVAALDLQEEFRNMSSVTKVQEAKERADKARIEKNKRFRLAEQERDRKRREELDKLFEKEMPFWMNVALQDIKRASSNGADSCSVHVFSDPWSDLPPPDKVALAVELATRLKHPDFGFITHLRVVRAEVNGEGGSCSIRVEVRW